MKLLAALPLVLATSVLASTPERQANKAEKARNATKGVGKDGDVVNAPEVPPFIWKDPFLHESYAKYTPACEATVTFPALQHTLNDLLSEPPKGLKPWSNALKSFFGKSLYPGGWDGYDPHKLDRHVMKMEYSDLPAEVRKWIETKTEEGDQKLFAIYEKPEGFGMQVPAPKTKTPEDRAEFNNIDADSKVVVFAPGAIYEILPLFVADKSECADQLRDLSRYSPEPKDGGVVAFVTDRKSYATEDGREFEFTIQAQVLQAGLEAEASARDEL